MVLVNGRTIGWISQLGLTEAHAGPLIILADLAVTSYLDIFRGIHNTN